MRVKFSVEQLDAMFRFLDRGEKGYISYLDFCALAEERRMGLDVFEQRDPHENGARGGSQLAHQSKITRFLQEQNIQTLEQMCKWRTPKTRNKAAGGLLKTTAPPYGGASQQDRTANLPGWIAQNQEHAFGRPSANQQAKSSSKAMAAILNNEYSRRFLTDIIKRNAREQVSIAR